jgi:hypothetical protein
MVHLTKTMQFQCIQYEKIIYTSQNFKPATRYFQITLKLIYETMWIFTRRFVCQYSIIQQKENLIFWEFNEPWRFQFEKENRARAL